jgi:hypothetical protein
MYARAARSPLPARPAPPSAAPVRRPPQSLLLVGIDTRPTEVDVALVSLDTIATRLRMAYDARAVFPEVYAVITRNVAAVIRAGGVFLEPAWIARLAGRFAERYFEALIPSLTGAPVASTAWRVAFDAGRADARVPVRDALLGINAHINYDLAQGIADNIRAAGHADDARMLARYRHDHDAVNTILRASAPAIYELLLTRYACPVTWVATRNRHLNAAVTHGALRVIGGWRSDVWADMLVLLRSPDTRAHGVGLRAMDRRSGRFARAFAASNPAWIRRAARDLLYEASALSFG